MKPSDIQRELKAAGLYPGKIDGILGPQSRQAIATFLGKKGVKLKSKAADIIVAFEQQFYKDKGLDPGAIDGLDGPATRRARLAWATKQATGAFPDLDEVNTPATYKNPPKTAKNWPKQAGREAFFGKPGTNHVALQLPFPLRLAWDPGTVVNKFTINKMCHDEALLAFNRIKEAYSFSDIQKHGFDLFGGCFNDRSTTSGKSKSTHAYAAAIDFDPLRNGYKTTSRTAYLAKPECKRFVDIWYEVGAVSIGRELNYDWMHFEFARYGK